MTVCFKFRSSLNFDAVDIDGRSFISVRDLKSKIVRFKNLTICQDFDLVLSDALTGQEYVNENFQIPDGSSVIIKRVPAESVQVKMPLSNANENLQMKETVNHDPAVSPNIKTVDFDDFGVDLYPVSEATLSSSNFNVENKTFILGVSPSPNVGVAARCFDPAVGGCPKHETCLISDSIPGRPACDGVEEDVFHKKLELKAQKEMKKVDTAKVPTLQNDNLPPELKCSVCNSFFKEALMIPCCQHSFCQKCIYQVLLEKARCPKCFSSKCRIEDLLPNVSLRQAIKHFLESKYLAHVLGNNCLQYASDGESGIQAKDVSCGVSVFQKAPELHHSHSGRGSNHLMAELPCKSLVKGNALNANDFLKSHHSLHEMKQIDKTGPGDLVDCDDFQGESQPMHEKAESTAKKKRKVQVDNKGGHKIFVDPGRRKKGDQRCYMCGSPDHFVRDCPAALSARPIPPTGNFMFPRTAGNSMFPWTMSGYVPFWSASPMHHVRPHGSFYGNCGMIPFNRGIAPAAPFAVPTYMSSMYRPMPVLGFCSRCMRVGVGPQLRTSEDIYASHSEFLEVQECEKRRMLLNQNFGREPLLLDDENEDFNRMCFVGDKETFCDHKAHISNEKSQSDFDDGSTRSSRSKNYHQCHRDDDMHLADEYPQKISHRYQKHYYRPERSSSELDDLPCSSSCHSDEVKKHHNKSYKKHDGKKEHDFSRHHPRARSESDSSRKRVEYGVGRHKRKHCSSEFDLVSSRKEKQRKEARQSSTNSKHNSRSNNVEPHYNRWEMVSGSDEDGAEEYRYYKRKKGH